MITNWIEEEYFYCPCCNNKLMGKIIGPKVTHYLKCTSCSFESTTDQLRIYRSKELDKMTIPQFKDIPKTKFVGYDTYECECKIVGILGK